MPKQNATTNQTHIADALRSAIAQHATAEETNAVIQNILEAMNQPNTELNSPAACMLYFRAQLGILGKTPEECNEIIESFKKKMQEANQPQAQDTEKDNDEDLDFDLVDVPEDAQQGISNSLGEYLRNPLVSNYIWLQLTGPKAFLLQKLANQLKQINGKTLGANVYFKNLANVGIVFAVYGIEAGIRSILAYPFLTQFEVNCKQNEEEAKEALAELAQDKTLDEKEMLVKQKELHKKGAVKSIRSALIYLPTMVATQVLYTVLRNTFYADQNTDNLQQQQKDAVEQPYLISGMMQNVATVAACTAVEHYAPKVMNFMYETGKRWWYGAEQTANSPTQQITEQDDKGAALARVQNSLRQN